MTRPEPHRADDLLRPSPVTVSCRPLAAPVLADIAAGLARSAPLWLGQVPALASQRSGIRLLATREYDAWLLRWPARTSVTPHDHGDSVGAFTVVSGELTEVRWHRTLRRTRLVSPGDVVGIERGVVHDVIASSPVPSVSVHVYSPPLTAMGYFDDDGSVMVDRQVVDGSGGAIAPGRALHPSAR